MHVTRSERVTIGLDGNLYFANLEQSDSKEDYICHAQYREARTILPATHVSLSVEQSEHTHTLSTHTQHTRTRSTHTQTHTQHTHSAPHTLSTHTACARVSVLSQNMAAHVCVSCSTAHYDTVCVMKLQVCTDYTLSSHLPGNNVAYDGKPHFFHPIRHHSKILALRGHSVTLECLPKGL